MPSFLRFLPANPARRSLGWLSLLLVGLPWLAQAQCPSNGVLTTQEQVNAFPPGCVNLEVELRISGANITNLRPLANLQTIGTYALVITANTSLSSLSGLEKLTSVEGAVNITNNPALNSLQGLNNLNSAGGFDIINNSALPNLNGLEKLTSVRGDIRIHSNPALLSLQGLNQLSSVGASFTIRVNAVLTNLRGLEKLTSVQNLMNVENNPALTSLQGLNQLTSAGGIEVKNNALTNLSGLDKLTSVGVAVSIENNPTLLSLQGLNQLTSVGASVAIRGNALLTNLQGLDKLRSARGITIYNNPNLSGCAIESICQLLNSNVSAQIFNNAPGCNSKPEIQADCSPLAITTQPPTQSAVCVGATVTAAVSTTGNVRAYQWYKGNQLVTGQTSAMFTLTNVQPIDEGAYRVVVSNSVSSLTSTAFTLTVNAQSSDYQPLVDFYNSMGGANWTNKTNWLTGCDVCSWYGVSCTNGRVTALSLIGNNLLGTLPASLSALTSLQSLEVGANALTGGIPTGIGSLTALQTLNLSRTQLGGSIPANLGQLSQLRNLYLNESALTGSLPASLGNLTQLVNLTLNTNQLSGCFPGSYTNLCGKNVSFAGNPNLPGGGDFAAFCRDGTGGELVVSQGPQSGTACAGSAFSFSVVARGAASYQWYKLGPRQGQFQLLAETGSVLSFSSVSSADAGNYQVVINYACGNGAIQSDVVTLTVPPGQASLVSSGTLSCARTSVTLTASGGSSYTFTSSEGQVLGTPGPSNTLAVNSAGVYNVRVANASGCVSTTSITVTRNAEVPLATLSASPSTTLTCAQTSLTLTAGGGSTYAFSGGVISGNQTVVSTAGVYSVTVSNGNGCTAVATTRVESSTARPTVSISPTSATLTCASPTAELTATGDGSFVWSTGQTGSPITVSRSGVYSVTVVSANGCSAVASVSVSQDNAAPMATISGSLTVVSGGSTVLTAVGGISVTWSTGQASASISVMAGVYSVTVINVNGCTSSTSVTVTTANQAPIATTNASQTATVGQIFAYTVAAFSDAETPDGLTYTASISPANELSFDAATRVISGTPSEPGLVSVTVTATDPGDLSASTSFTITVSPAPVVVTPLALTLSASPTTILTTGTTTLSATVSGGTAGSPARPYSYTFAGPGTILTSANSAQVTNLPAGVQTFTVVASDATQPVNQSISATVSVTVNAPTPVNTTPVATTNASQTATVGQPFAYTVAAFSDAETPDGLTYTASISPANGLSFDAATRVISGTPSLSGVATVNITATDPGGLSASSSFAITVSASAVIPTSPATLTITNFSCYYTNSMLSGVNFVVGYSNGTFSPALPSLFINGVTITGQLGTPYTLGFDGNQSFLPIQDNTSRSTYFVWDFRRACFSAVTPPTPTAPVAPALPNQTATVGTAFRYPVPAFSGTQPITYSASGLPAGLSFDASSRVISGVPSLTGVSTVVISASNTGGQGSGQFTLTVSGSATPPPVGAQPLSLLAPLYDCGTGSFTFQTSGGDGTPIEYFAVGITGPTGVAGPYVVRPAGDAQPFTLRARQSGVEVTYVWDFKAQCGASARLGAAEVVQSWMLRSVGNPVTGELVVEVVGAASQSLQLHLTDLNGRLVESRLITPTTAQHREVFGVARQGAGVLLLQAQSSTRCQTLKVVKQ